MTVADKSNDAHFHVYSGINTNNCCIWADTDQYAGQQIPLHSPKVTVWSVFTAPFIIDQNFYEEVGRNGLVTYSVTSNKNAYMLENFVIPHLH